MQHGDRAQCLSSHYVFLLALCCFLGLSLICAPVYVYTCCPPASVEKLHLPSIISVWSADVLLGCLGKESHPSTLPAVSPTRCGLRSGDRPFRNVSMWRDLGLPGRPSALAGLTLHLLPSPGLCHPPEHREPEKNRMPRDFPWADPLQKDSKIASCP